MNKILHFKAKNHRDNILPIIGIVDDGDDMIILCETNRNVRICNISDKEYNNVIGQFMDVNSNRVIILFLSEKTVYDSEHKPECECSPYDEDIIK